MKRSFVWWIIASVLVLAAACGDGRSKDSGQEVSPHAAHQQQPASQHDMEGMDGMVMSKSGSVDTALLSVVAAANKVVLSDQSSVATRRLDTTITLQGVGTVTWDVRRNRRLAARTGGRVEVGSAGGFTSFTVRVPLGDGPVVRAPGA